MPHPTVKTPPVTCPECGKGFVPKDPRRLFCTPEHKRAFNNRLMTLGGPLIILAKAWRQGRHKKGDRTAKYAFAEFCLALDRANAEDREANRPPALEVLRSRYKRQGIGVT